MLVVSVICTLYSCLCQYVKEHVANRSSLNAHRSIAMQRYGKKKPFESKMKLDGSGWEF